MNIIFIAHWLFKCTIVITRCPSSVRPSLTFHIFDFCSETTTRNSTKLEREQYLNVLYQVCVFGPIRTDQNRSASASDWLRHFWRNSTKLDGKQYHIILFEVCVFRPIGKTKGPPLHLINWDIFNFSFDVADWTSTNLTGSKISMFSVESAFLGRSKNQDGRPCLWLVEIQPLRHLIIKWPIKLNISIDILI